MSKLQDQIKATQAQLATLQEQLEVEDRAAKPWPQVGDTCYYISPYYGDIVRGKWKRRVCSAIEYAHSIDELFKTSEEAVRYQNKQKARAKLLALIKEANDGWVPDWQDPEEPKFYIVYHAEDAWWDWHTCHTLRILPDAYYIKSVTEADRLLDRVTEEFLEDALL